MTENGVWVIYVIIFLIVIGVTILVVVEQKKSIRESLEKKGAKDIKISYMPLDFDRSNNTYVVEYEDAEGKKHSRTCKIHFWEDSIYWEEES